MKTSLNELQLIEDFLLLPNNEEDKVLMEARILLRPDLRESIGWQQKTYQLVHAHGRSQLREEIRQVHEKLFTAPEHSSFRKRIMRFFNR